MAFSPKVRDVRPSNFFVIIIQSEAAQTKSESTFAPTAAFQYIVAEEYTNEF